MAKKNEDENCIDFQGHGVVSVLGFGQRLLFLVLPFSE